MVLKCVDLCSTGKKQVNKEVNEWNFTCIATQSAHDWAAGAWQRCRGIEWTSWSDKTINLPGSLFGCTTKIFRTATWYGKTCNDSIRTGSEPVFFPEIELTILRTRPWVVPTKRMSWVLPSTLRTPAKNKSSKSEGSTFKESRAQCSDYNTNFKKIK